MTVTSINRAKQQSERDEAELRSVREMTEQHQKAMDYLHERARTGEPAWIEQASGRRCCMSIRELNLTKEQHDWLNGWLELWGHGFIRVVWKSA